MTGLSVGVSVVFEFVIWHRAGLWGALQQGYKSGKVILFLRFAIWVCYIFEFKVFIFLQGYLSGWNLVRHMNYIYYTRQSVIIVMGYNFYFSMLLTVMLSFVGGGGKTHLLLEPGWIFFE